MSIKFRQPLPPDVVHLYRRAKLAMLTGWTFDYIDNLGLIDEESLWQIHDAESWF